ncbi:MAG: hypothetical protein KDB18_11180, partial [Salinibacterium sp.]|nr:hypothetical protein [Salinibacterium sp.]
MLVDGGRLIDVGSQSKGQAEERSRGCIDCHKGVVEPHGQAVHLSCIDCHGGDGLSTDIETAHPRADHPEKWPKGGANPERPYTLTLHENWDWIRFVNPGDLRVARTTCAPCHPNHTLNVSKSVMTTVSHFWAVAGYANGIVSPKRSVFGESYSPEGRPQMVHQLVPKDEDAPRSADNWREATAAEIEKHSFVNGIIIPLPHFEITQTGNIFRVFEQGSRLGGPALGFNGLPLP